MNDGPSQPTRRPPPRDQARLDAAAARAAKKSDRVELLVAHTWEGVALPPDEQTRLVLSRVGADLRVQIDAPYYRDPKPNAPVGSFDGLWDHEVVELFIADASDRYLELEFGPHGHYLALSFHGMRQRRKGPHEITFTANIESKRWLGEAHVPHALLPYRGHRVNAYAMHGDAKARSYHAYAPMPGEQPDFHRLEWFGALDLEL